MTPPVVLRGINVHPVKSTALRPVDRALITVRGLLGDREWMVVDDAGEMVTAREVPELFLVVADTPMTGGPADVPLRLSAPDLPPLELGAPDSPGRAAAVFGRPVNVSAAGPEADAWLAKAVGRDGLHLVRQAPRDDERTTLQDGSAMSVASMASMARLNSWMGLELPVSRFRANLVVEGDLEPFAEDRWSWVCVGEAVLRVERPISRCVMTTVDAGTLERAKEPIRTLARYRRWNGRTWFGVYLSVERPGRVAVGDEVRVG